MKKAIQSVKGTRDFYPEQMSVRTWLYNTVKEVSRSFGYQEYEAPILEPLELYAAKSGEELVQEQAYVFADRGGSQIALRPELTPSLARMIAQKQNQLTFPVRWWSFGPFWRYERPQKGRTREFFQWNVDILGADSPEADAENVAVLATFFQRVGLEPNQVLILVNDRRLIDSQFDRIGLAKEKRPAAYAWIDRRGKLKKEEWESNGEKNGLSSRSRSGIITMLEDQSLWKESQNLVRFFSAIEALGLSRFVAYDPAIVRGLLYYTGTVFEAWEVSGDIKRSILGGGRYDNLLADVGGDPLPAVGFAMGDVVIMLLLEKYGLIPEKLEVNPAQVLVTIFDPERAGNSLKIATELRNAGINVAVYPESAKLQKQFKYADRLGTRLVVVIGPDEAEKNQAVIKDLSNGAQQTVDNDAVVRSIQRML